MSAAVITPQGLPRSVAADLAATLMTCAQQRIGDAGAEHHSIGLQLDQMNARPQGPQALRCRGTYSNRMTEQVDVAALSDGHTT